MATVGDVLFHRDDDQDSDVWDDTALVKAYDKAVNHMKDKMGLSADKTPASNKSAKSRKKKKNKNKSKANKTNTTADTTLPWRIGDRCQAIYSEDGLIYEAKIIGLDEDGVLCTVRYLGYGNEEEQELTALMPPEASGCASDYDSMDWHSAAGMSTSRTSTPRPGSRSTTASTAGRGRGGFPWPAYPPTFPGMNPGAGMFPMMPPMCPPMPAGMPGPMGSGMPGGMPGWSPQSMLGALPPPPVVNDDLISSDKEALYSMLISWYMSGYHTGYYQGLKQGKQSSSGRHQNRRGRHHHNSTTEDR